MNTVSDNTRLERHKQQTRLALMRAAYDLILQHGYDTVTVGAIADHANYGRATFYLHFADKEALVWAIMQRHYDAEARKVLEQHRNQPSPIREYLGWVAMFQDVVNDLAFYRQLQGRSEERLWERTRQYLLQQTEHNLRVGNYQAAPMLPIEFMAHFFVGATLEVMRWWRDNNYAQSAPEMAGMLFMMVYQQPPPELPDGLSPY
jgi:AcrR family transcriptional regulator